MKNVLLACAISLVASCSAIPAMAGVCLDLETGLRMLADRYKEVPTTVFTFNQQQVPGMKLLLTTNPTTKTWTMIRVDDKGMACMLASGAGIQQLPVIPLPEGELN